MSLRHTRRIPPRCIDGRDTASGRLPHTIEPEAALAASEASLHWAEEHFQAAVLCGFVIDWRLRLGDDGRAGARPSLDGDWSGASTVKCQPPVHSGGKNEALDIRPVHYALKAGARDGSVAHRAQSIDLRLQGASVK